MLLLVLPPLVHTSRNVAGLPICLHWVPFLVTIFNFFSQLHPFDLIYTYPHICCIDFLKYYFCSCRILCFEALRGWMGWAESTPSSRWVKKRTMRRFARGVVLQSFTVTIVDFFSQLPIFDLIELRSIASCTMDE